MKKAPVLNEKQYKSLLNATKMTRYADRNRMMVVLSYGVGLRACEIAAITVGDVLDSENNVRETVFLGAHQTKGSKSHSVYLSDSVRKEIAKYIKLHKEFLTTRKSPLLRSQKGGKMVSHTVQIVLKDLYRKIGLDTCSSHSGRRTFITNLSEKGVSTRVIQELARHSSLAVTQQYIDVSVDKLRNAVNLVAI